MANKNTTKTRRRPSKAELERKQAIQRMLISLALAICLIFAALKWGAVGITVYNLIRLLVGSLAYLAIFSLLIYLFFFKWIHKQEGLLAGFFFIFAGLLLIFQAYLVWKLSMANAVFQGTIGQIFKDLTSFQVTSFAGGGLLGVGLYIPVAFLFSNIGTYFIGAILILIGALLMSPWSIYDIADFLSARFAIWMERREQKKQERFIKREEEKARREAEEQSRLEKEREEQALLDMQPVDMETGEILSDQPLQEFPPLSEEEWVEPEIILPQADFDYPEEGNYPEEEVFSEEDDDDEEVEVDFSAKKALEYKLPSLQLFAPDKPKDQSKEKKIVRENIKILEAQAMRGELDFEASLKRRVSLLKGLSINVFDKIYHELHLSKNAARFIKVLQENQIEVGLVSGGFTTIVERLAKDLGISLYTANQLEIKDDHLTGNLIGPIISREVKEERLIRWAEELEVPFDRTIAIGDGANDLKMLKSAGLGIAFCAKDIVKKEINLQVDERDFGKVLEMIDFL